MRKHKNKIAWPVSYRLISIGTLVAYSAVGTRTFNLARAQDLHQAAALPQV